MGRTSHLTPCQSRSASGRWIATLVLSSVIILLTFLKHPQQIVDSTTRRLLSQDEPPEAEERVPVLTVFFLTVLMAACSALGAVPFFFVDGRDSRMAGPANALACGVMLAASFDLIHEAQPYGCFEICVGLALGGWFIKASQEFLHRFDDLGVQNMTQADARKTLLIMGIMTVHAIGEGSGVGVSFSGGWSEGIIVSTAIGLHNIPEGMAVATVLVSKGTPPKRALLWCMFTSLPQPLLAVPSYIFVEAFQALLPLAMGFAAGCMIWMVFAELLPDALAETPPSLVASLATLSAGGLEAFRMVMAEFEAGKSPGAGWAPMDVFQFLGIVSPLGFSGLVVWSTTHLLTLVMPTTVGRVWRRGVMVSVAAGVATSLALCHFSEHLLWEHDYSLLHISLAGMFGSVVMLGMVSLSGMSSSSNVMTVSDDNTKTVPDVEAPGGGGMAAGLIGDRSPSDSTGKESGKTPGDIDDEDVNSKDRRNLDGEGSGPGEEVKWVVAARAAFGAHLMVEGLQIAGAAMHAPLSTSYVAVPAMVRNLPVCAALTLFLLPASATLPNATGPSFGFFMKMAANTSVQQVAAFLAFAHAGVGGCAMNGSTLDLTRSIAAGMLATLAFISLRDTSRSNSQLAIWGSSIGGAFMLCIWIASSLLCSLTPYCIDPQSWKD